MRQNMSVSGSRSLNCTFQNVFLEDIPAEKKRIMVN